MSRTSLSFVALSTLRVVRHGARRSMLCLPLLTTACNAHPLDVVEARGQLERPISFDFAPQNKVDILLVLDNSGSMGEEQANLAANFGAFVDRLDEAGADYRIAVTTTDVQNSQWCGNTTPENGKFQASSCRTRLGRFEDQAGGVNVEGIACTDICSLDELGLLPTLVDFDNESRVRPWIQSGGSQSNLPEGTGAFDAFRCMAPQGIDGCGFESPLEAMRLALLRANTASEAEFGFLRDDAKLSVIIVTDEVDCSVAPGGDTIFDPAGERVFWSDPSSVSPTSAACWNAGVTCSGDADNYDDCVAANKNAQGEFAAGSADAVLRPVQDYIDAIDTVLADKDNRGIHVALLGGVPADFGDTMTIPYGQSSDPVFQDKFGIGAGCSSEVNGVVQQAVPPVRMRELVEAFDATQMFSVCEADYTPALQSMVEQLTPGLRGACVTECLADADPTTPGINPVCNMSEVYADGTKYDLPQCELEGDTWVTPDGAEACVAYRGDIDKQTPTPADDPHPYCELEGPYVAIEVYRADGGPAPEGSVIQAVCSGDANPAACA